jgi:threonyl-tRNA synthetase
MNIGMLWYDNDNKSDLATKIQKAVNYYHLKYGKEPNLCLVHPRTLGSSSWTSAGLEVRTTRSVLPNHFWLGVNNNRNPVKS